MTVGNGHLDLCGRVALTPRLFVCPEFYRGQALEELRQAAMSVVKPDPEGCLDDLCTFYFDQRASLSDSTVTALEALGSSIEALLPPSVVESTRREHGDDKLKPLRAFYYFTGGQTPDYHLHHGFVTATLFLDLSTETEGGRTHFNAALPEPVTVKPDPGMLMIWFNCDEQGNHEQRAQHKGLQVQNGTKLLINADFGNLLRDREQALGVCAGSFVDPLSSKTFVEQPPQRRSSEIKQLVSTFLRKGLATEHIEAVRQQAEAENGAAAANWYAKIMHKINQQGETYVEAETERVRTILQGKVTQEKRADLEVKLKVLGVFSESRMEL